jgi:hypothetical protein
MTLKEKFTNSIVLPFEYEEKIKKSLVIADDYAIEFANFIDKKYYQHAHHNNRYAESENDFASGKTYTIKELLEIFKKEKGL